MRASDCHGGDGRGEGRGGGGGGAATLHIMYGPRVRAIDGDVIMVACALKHTVQYDCFRTPAACIG